MIFYIKAMRTSLILFLLFSFKLSAQGGLELPCQVLIGVDWAQTSLVISKKDAFGIPKYDETNPIVGKHPSQKKLAAIVLATMTAHYFISKSLKQPYRKIFQISTIIIQGYVVYSNFTTLTYFKKRL